jgi:ribokinase
VSSALWDLVVCGSLNLDLVSQVPHLPQPGETLAATALVRLPGGKGLNQAVAAARQGAKVAMLGAVGADPEGQMLRAVLEAEQIAHQGVATLNPPTGLALINVAAHGDNAIVIHGGANRALSAPQVQAAMQPARVYLAQLEVPFDALQEFFGTAQQPGSLRILNAAPATGDAIALLTEIDLLIVNEIELHQLATQHAEHTETLIGEDCAPLARGLLTDSLRTVIVTLGAQGARIIDADHDTPIAAPPVSVVDTTGAGDCFCGVLAAALAEGLPLIAAATRAVNAASQAVQVLGAIAAMPRRDRS